MRTTVTVVVSGLQDIVKQDYPIKLIQENREDTTVFFNEQLDILDTDIVCFMSHLDNFNANDVISRAVSKLNQHSSLGLLYSDIMSVNNGYTSPIYYPAFHPNILFSDIIINSPPIFKKPPQGIKFDTSLSLLYFHAFTNRLGRRVFPVHIAEPLFISQQNLSVDFKTEFEKLQKCLNQ